jgi:hypothetical protein
MKSVLVLICLGICVTINASAQQTIEQTLKGMANQLEPSLTAKDAAKRVGAEVYVCDTVFSYKVINDTLRAISIGNRKRKEALIIILKGSAVKNAGSSIGGRMCVSGKVIWDNSKPAIVVTNSGQLGVRIQI